MPTIILDTPSAGYQSWYVPAGVTKITAEAIGRGGKGGDVINAGAGGGGGGGGYAKYANFTVTPGQELRYILPTSTSGGSVELYIPNVTTIVLAASGQNGGGAVYFDPENFNLAGVGGSGGAGNIGQITYSGGGGSAGQWTVGPGTGGGGAGSTGNGGAASGITPGTGTTLYGGNGGYYAVGSNYGGGGGGEYSNFMGDYTGFIGGKGAIIITYTLPSGNSNFFSFF